MDFINDYKDIIFSVNKDNFVEISLELFRFQSENNPVFSQYQELLGIDYKKINTLEEIPFLPVEVFKSHRVITGNKPSQRIFLSSGTTGSRSSRHYIVDINLYADISVRGFELFFDDINKWTFLGLLPSYLERNESSLVFMVSEFMKRSKKKSNGFFLNDYSNLAKKLKQLNADNQPVVLFGVSFALLDFAEKFPMDLQNTIVIETGGMKGRKPELLRDELHKILKEKFNKQKICSEYGMTELLSQCYSFEDGIFNTPPWARIMIRDLTDPFRYQEEGEQGAINIIDLANIFSCSFIATSDLGRLAVDGSFEVQGRIDNSDIRGCNLLAYP